MLKLSSLSKSLVSCQLRGLVGPLLASATALASGCGISDVGESEERDDVPTFEGKTAEEIEAEAEAGATGGKGAANLVSQWIPCGEVRGFPTWTFWGYTTAEAVNHTPGTRIRLSYQAGFGGTEFVELTNFASWGARWAGATLWVTYLGYYDSNGYYRNCSQYAPPPPDAPHLIVQTY